MEQISADHVWPALYPAMILGGLIGLTARATIGAFVGTVVGIAGGMIGATAGLLVSDLVGIETSFIRLLAILLPSAAGAAGFVRLCQHFLMRARH